MLMVYIIRMYKLQFANTPSGFGTFGDYVGGVVGAFTGLLSVVFLYFTYLKQIEIFEEQQKQTKLHQFEENFFHLLANYRSIVPSLQNNKRETGLEYIRSVRKLIEKPIDDICKKQDALIDLNTLVTRESINEQYKTAFEAESDQLGHYFRSLYHLLKYIEKHCPSGDDRKMYFDLVQAQMNTDELYLTCINGISSYGRKKMQPLLNRSSFLENLAIDENETIRKLVYFYYPLTKKKNVAGIRNNVIIIAGTEGSRKSRLMKRLREEQIPVRMTSVPMMLHTKGLNSIDYLNNQEYIKEMLRKKIDPDETYVLCCSFAQLLKDGQNKRLPLTIYEDIHPIAVLLMKSPIDYMIMSIKREERISLNTTQAELYLENEETTASDYAGEKDVPFLRFRCEDIDAMVNIIKQLSERLD